MKKIEIAFPEEALASFISQLDIADILEDREADDIVDALIELDERKGEWDLMNSIFTVFLSRIVDDMDIDTLDNEYLSDEVRSLLIAYKTVKIIKKVK